MSVSKTACKSHSHRHNHHNTNTYNADDYENEYYELGSHDSPRNFTHIYNNIMKDKQKYNHAVTQKQLHFKASPQNKIITNNHKGQGKRVEKLQKLKLALKSAQKHNQQLHTKIKYLKAKTTQKIKDLQQEVLNYKNKIVEIKHDYEQQIKNIKKSKDHQIKSLSAGKLTLEKSSLHQNSSMQIQLKSKDMKIVQLQAKILELNTELKTTKQLIQQTQAGIKKIKTMGNQEEEKKMAKIYEQLQNKTNQNFEILRENSKLKDSLKQSLKKVQKIGLLYQQQTQKNKVLKEQLKQNKLQVQLIRKQINNENINTQKIKQQNIQKMQMLNKLEKTLLQSQFNYKRQKQKNQQLVQKYEKIQLQFNSLLNQFKNLSVKHSQLITTHYQLQRDLQRELHTIVKQLTRRHIVSKSLVSHMSSNSASTINYNSIGNSFGNNNQHSNDNHPNNY